MYIKVPYITLNNSEYMSHQNRNKNTFYLYMITFFYDVNSYHTFSYDLYHDLTILTVEETL